LSGVSEDELDLRLVLRVAEDALGELKHGGDTSTTADHDSVRVAVGLVLELLAGALNVKHIARLELCEVLGHLARGIGLDEQGELTLLVGVDRGVRTDDVLLTVVVASQDVAGERSINSSVGALKLKVVDSSVVVVAIDRLDLHRDELIGVHATMGLTAASLDSCSLGHERVRLGRLLELRAQCVRRVKRETCEHHGRGERDRASVLAEHGREAHRGTISGRSACSNRGTIRIQLPRT